MPNQPYPHACKGQRVGVRQNSEFTLLSDKEHIGKLLNRYTIYLPLVLENAPVYRVIVFTVDEIIAYEAIIIAPELHDGEAVKLRKDTILSELLEPWRANLIVDFLVGFAVALELDGNLGNPSQPLCEHPR